MTTLVTVANFIRKHGHNTWAATDSVEEALEFIKRQTNILRLEAVRPRQYSLTAEERRAWLAQATIKCPFKGLVLRFIVLFSGM